ncbi:MAG: endonuclease domain-containing protein, partial [Candidatus Cyclobacteriaceae bacterium M3_2C_046]
YILDFYCSEAKVGIELDGYYHQDKNQKAYDFARENLIKEKYGIRILRFWNSEVENSLEMVLENIVKFIKNSD